MGSDDFIVVHATSRTHTQSQSQMGTRTYGSNTYKIDESADAFELENGYNSNDEDDGDGDGDSEWGGSRVMRQRSAILRNNYNQVSKPFTLLPLYCFFESFHILYSNPLLMSPLFSTYMCLLVCTSVKMLL